MVRMLRVGPMILTVLDGFKNRLPLAWLDTSPNTKMHGKGAGKGNHLQKCLIESDPSPKCPKIHAFICLTSSLNMFKLVSSAQVK